MRHKNHQKRVKLLRYRPYLPDSTNSDSLAPMPYPQQVSSTNTGEEDSMSTKPFISRLPPELYKEIITFVMQLVEDRIYSSNERRNQLITLSHVSQAFRDAALDSPKLWSCILSSTFYSPPASACYDEVYKRTRKAPLKVIGELHSVPKVRIPNFEWNHAPSKRIMVLLESEIQRIAHLDLSWDSNEAEHDWEPITEVLFPVGRPERALPLQLSCLKLCTRQEDIHYIASDSELVSVDVDEGGGGGGGGRGRRRIMKLFESTPRRCTLFLGNCSISPTLVTLPRLVKLTIDFHLPSHTKVALLLEWWDAVTDGSNNSCLEALEVLQIGYFNLGSTIPTGTPTTTTTRSGSIHTARPRRSFPTNLKTLHLHANLTSYAHLFLNDDSSELGLPESCTGVNLKCSTTDTDSDSLSPSDIERVAKRLAGVVASVPRRHCRASRKTNLSKNSLSETPTTGRKSYSATSLHISALTHEEFTLRFSAGRIKSRSSAHSSSSGGGGDYHQDEDADDEYSSELFFEENAGDWQEPRGVGVRYAAFTKGALQVDVSNVNAPEVVISTLSNENKDKNDRKREDENEESWLALSCQCTPAFGRYIRKAYTGFLKQFDDVQNLHFSSFGGPGLLPSIFMPSPSRSSSAPLSAYYSFFAPLDSTTSNPTSTSTSNSNPILLPNIQHVRINHSLLMDKKAVSEFNKFDAQRTAQLGYPIPRVSVQMTYPRPGGAPQEVVAQRPLVFLKVTPVTKVNVNDDDEVDFGNVNVERDGSIDLQKEMALAPPGYIW